ncbi:DELLA protein RGL1-like [Tripterygium wilfordii]|uniref:DELLA protein RGL1-like n=1 Tax=Tripterygium wilfordii TaxID=458696 RepID=UPI0018F854DD|nr:DELLA protein RGL1-like [Tripterygium wilfordii]
MARAKRIHIINLGIKTEVRWTLLMQALASRNECPLESLSITAVGTCSTQMESACKWLMSFAETMNLPFSFMMVTVSDMFDLIEDQFEIDAKERVAIFSEFFMWTMIPQPDCLDSLMKVIRKFNPCVMVIIEVESNLNAPGYSVVVAEGEERKGRHVKIDVWRAFLSRFGMEEKELSMSSLYQAYLVVKKFACGNFCTLDMNEKSLIIGWKGTPLHSLSKLMVINVLSFFPDCEDLDVEDVAGANDNSLFSHLFYPF